ncbi:MAG: glycosyltransferase family 2 protein [Deltaproteobacteria bacterium]|nr:glycosyltransferase family 2 protein [Deltaproteobacteria bacterium]
MVSIVIAVMNSADSLEKCIVSCLTQSYSNIELIVIDGGSVDGSVDIIEKYSPQMAYWESNPDRGICHAWNKALKIIRGDWICFLGADDYFWNGESVAELIPFLHMAEMSAIRIVYAKVAIVNSAGDILWISGLPWEKIRRRFYSYMQLSHQGVMHHRSLFECHGPFNENLSIAGDYELLLRELVSNKPLFASDVILAAMVQGGKSNNPKNSMKMFREMHYARMIHVSRLPSVYSIMRFLKVSTRILMVKLIGEQRTRRLILAFRQSLRLETVL